MNISSTIRHQKPKECWFYNRHRRPGVSGESPADQVRDTLSIGLSSAAISALAAGAVSYVGAGPLGASAMALPLVIGGGIAGGLACGLSSELIGLAMNARPTSDAGTGAIAGGAVVCGLAAGAGAIAAGFGSSPGAVAATTAAISGGIFLLAGTLANI
jgi:hypothetical protein